MRDISIISQLSQRVIQIFIILITCVLAGMVALQLFWIGNSMNLRETEFKHEINAVLDDVVLELEKKENLERIGMGETSEPFLIEIQSSSEIGLEIEFKNTQSLSDELYEIEDTLKKLGVNENNTVNFN